MDAPYFSTYQEARASFRESARRVGAALDQYSIEINQHSIENLTIDVATIGAINPQWSVVEERVTVKTEFFRFENATSFPKCVQQPHPPVWVAAVRSQESFKWIAQQGFHLLITPGLSSYDCLADLVRLYQEEFLLSDHNRTPQIALSLPVLIRDSNTEAIEQGMLYLQRYLRIWGDAANNWNERWSKDYADYSGFGHALLADSPAAMRSRKAALIGTPDDVAQDIEFLRNKLGITVLLMQLDFGAMPKAEAQTTLELFCTHLGMGQ
jgi:alkanesulfonate monooxygenase SsuD/methylene tetrahydromethanopterin reductase-like flavin-dependent oxidoreductase (luciferase family)